MFGWWIGALVAGGFLVIGGPQIGVLLESADDDVVGCRGEAREHRTGRRGR
jgi:hypothetical protein